MTETLPSLPIRDYRHGGLSAYAEEHAQSARQLMETVLRGFGPARHLLRRALPWGDRFAERHLARIGDPYLPEIRTIREMLGVPGPIAFALSYEFGCTARGFPGEGVLFRTLDWPFAGLGRLAEIVHLDGPAGPWTTITWPGVVGALHGAAPGRFAIALNQAPERQTGWGRIADWVASKRRQMRETGLPPTHLLRQVFETAPDAETARRMLLDTQVAAPVIFTLLDADGRASTIERTESSGQMLEGAVAANHFMHAAEGRWRPRGYDSAGRLAMAQALQTDPGLDALSPPMLNPLTRLAVALRLDGSVTACGWEGEAPATAVTAAALPAPVPPDEIIGV